MKSAEPFTEPFSEDDEGEGEKRRSGRLFTNAYKQVRTQLFLVNLSQVQIGPTTNSSVLFVQRDFIQ
jgi:hypothetical protein